MALLQLRKVLGWNSNYGILLNFKRIIIIINYHNGSGKPIKFSRSRMTKRTVPLNSSREI